MKKIIIIHLAVLLLISVVVNVVLFNKMISNDKSKYFKTIVPDNKSLHDGKIEISNVINVKNNDYYVFASHYEPNMPGNWHIHPNGQILYVTGGEGYYQEEGKQLETIKEGDLIETQPNVKNWHGSQKNNYLDVIVLSKNLSKPLQQMEPVDMEYYNNIDTGI